MLSRYQIRRGQKAAELPAGVRQDSRKHTRHASDYIEISATDMDRARRFYESAFGWTFNEYGPDYMGIRKAGGGEAGGICRADEVIGGGPLVVLYSADLDATLQLVRQAEGRIVKEPFAFPGGRRFQFQDPSGNELAVWSEAGGSPLEENE